MEFDKSRVYTALNADELKPGSKCIFADCLNTLKEYVEQHDSIATLVKVNDEMHLSRFFDGECSWCLTYLISEPEEKKLKWTDLNIGDVITNGRHINMVTEIDKECEYNMHIYAGTRWLKDDELAEWEKVGD